jgi:hypothetical protein
MGHDAIAMGHIRGADGKVTRDPRCSTLTMSTAPIIPSTSPIAEVMRPSWPGRSGYRRRIVML